MGNYIPPNVNNIPQNEYMNLSFYLQEPSWQEALSQVMGHQCFIDLMFNLARASMAGKVIYPPVDLTFNAFNKTPLYKVVVGLHGLYREQMVKVVILGQDPYPSPGMAMGLAFSIPYGFPLTLSLRNIFNELYRDPNMVPNHGNLTSWAEQGVLLLNTTLTVEDGKPNSHEEFGWQSFTDHVIKLISDRCHGVVFMLWGNFALKKAYLINPFKHRIIETCHPASRNISPKLPFFGSCCFSRCNYALAKFGHAPINWSLPPMHLCTDP